MKENINKFKKIAISGISFMGIGSFMSCLTAVSLYKNLGTAILILGLILSIIGFYRRRP